MTETEAARRLLDRFPGSVRAGAEFRGEVSLIAAREVFRDVCAFCRDEAGFDCLLDVSGVDHFGEDPRFEVVYELCAIEPGTLLRLKVAVPEEDPEMPTVSDLWPAADWLEREVYDMHGIRFAGHPDLRRIIMWEGYPYFPLRKDFPLEGLDSDEPEVAFSAAAPLAGGPFVTTPTTGNTQVREPRARGPGDPPPKSPFLPEP